MNISKTTELYRYPSQVCLLCQKWPVDPSRKVTIRAETHKVAGQRAFVAAASPGVRQLEKQKSPFLNLRLFRKGATFCRWWATTCPPLHTKRSLQSNTHFTFQALPGSVLKLETSCQKEKCCQGPTDTSRSLAVLLVTIGLWIIQLISAWHFVHFNLEEEFKC
jgi:hypothetical protein